MPLQSEHTLDMNGIVVSGLMTFRMIDKGSSVNNVHNTLTYENVSDFVSGFMDADKLMLKRRNCHTTGYRSEAPLSACIKEWAARADVQPCLRVHLFSPGCYGTECQRLLGYSNPSLSRTPLSRILDNPDKF